MSICLVFMLMEDDLEDACNQLADFIVKVDEKTPDPLVASTAIELITEAKRSRRPSVVHEAGRLKHRNVQRQVIQPEQIQQLQRSEQDICSLLLNKL